MSDFDDYLNTNLDEDFEFGDEDDEDDGSFYLDAEDIHTVLDDAFGDDDEDDEDDEDYVDDDDDDYVEHSYTVAAGNEDEEDDEDEDEDDDEGQLQPSMLLEIAQLINSASDMSADARDSILSRLLQPSARRNLLQRMIRIPEPTEEERAAKRRRERWWTPQSEPHPNGTGLLRGGEFGPVGPWKPPGGKRRTAWPELYGCRKPMYSYSTVASEPTIPNTPGTVVASYPSVPYVGQYCGPDYGVFYSATQHFTLHMYSTAYSKTSSHHPNRSEAGIAASSNAQRRDDEDDALEEEAEAAWHASRYHRSASEDTSLHKIKTVQGVQGQWTVTDADADKKGEKMIYSSITPYVHMLYTAEHESDHITLDFTSRLGSRHYGDDHFGIWSIRFSADGKEVVAGAGSGYIMVYDIEAERRSLAVPGHRDDVNAVCFADESSTNILVSGSDDGYVKIWDRRSLSSSTPAGVLAGATEGITYAAPKGDGRYIVVNSKDQAARLYDLRKMRNWSEFEREPDAVARYGNARYDYRSMRYSPPKMLAHPKDCSVMTYRGHSVLRTLIRCHFSPRESTGQSYIYSGSADGLIHIWSLDGRVVQVLNRAESVPLRNSQGEYNDPSAPEPPRTHRRIGADSYESRGRNWTVRDVAWHGYEPTLMSTCWEVEGTYRYGGSLAKHEWKGLGKGGLRKLEDWVDKAKTEAAESRAF